MVRFKWVGHFQNPYYSSTDCEKLTFLGHLSTTLLLRHRTTILKLKQPQGSQYIHNYQISAELFPNPFNQQTCRKADYRKCFSFQMQLYKCTSTP